MTAALPAPAPSPRETSAPRPGLLRWNAATVWIATSAAVVLLAMALRTVWGTNWDVSWLLCAAERTLDGDVLYRDIVESNPPASILIYMPAVLAARALGTRPEFMTDALVFTAAGASLSLACAILSGTVPWERARAAALLCTACIVLLLLPLNSFAQREQIAVLALLPCLASVAARASGRSLNLAQAILAGLGAGVVLAIKPVFALALIGPMMVLARHRPWRVVARSPEPWIAAGVVAAYTLVVAVLFPAYAERVLPLLVRIYIPARLSFLDLLSTPTIPLWLVLVATFWRFRIRGDTPAEVLVLASVGFQAAYFVQGKGHEYHAYPALALAALGCAVSATRGGDPCSRARALRCAPVAACLAAGMLVFSHWEDVERDAPGLKAAIAVIAPHPRLLLIGSNMALGCVFARANGGAWVGSAPNAWITLFAYTISHKAEQESRFAEAIRNEREVYARDIEGRLPDAVLIEDSGWARWSKHSPALVRALSAYERVGMFGTVTLLRRIATPGTAPMDRAGGQADASEPGSVPSNARGSLR